MLIDNLIFHFFIITNAGRTDSSGTNPASDIVATQMTYKYDDFGRKIKETDPLGKYWAFEYDVNNNIKTVTDAKSQVTGYTWGYGHQMLTRTNTAGNTTYTRNGLGQVLTAKTPEVTYTYTYDDAHRGRRDVVALLLYSLFSVIFSPMPRQARLDIPQLKQ